MDIRIEQSWKDKLKAEFEKPYFVDLTTFIKSEYSKNAVYPPGKLIFNAFDKCPFDQVKVVLLGQDPYHEPEQAHGLCFQCLILLLFLHRYKIYSKKYGMI
jgi:uracil-DNA glycosylase